MQLLRNKGCREKGEAAASATAAASAAGVEETNPTRLDQFTSA